MAELRQNGEDKIVARRTTPGYPAGGGILNAGDPPPTMPLTGGVDGSIDCLQVSPPQTPAEAPLNIPSVSIEAQDPHPSILDTLSPQFCPPVGGRLGLFAQAWQRRGAHPWVVSVLQEGYALEFCSPLPMTLAPVVTSSADPHRQAALWEQFGEMVSKGALERVTNTI